MAFDNSFILSINAGSSSLKLQLFSIKNSGKSPKLVIKSSISNLTSSPAKFTYKNNVKKDIDKEGSNIDSKDVEDIKSDSDAFDYFLEHLEKDKAFGDKDKITHICHRVVHGGEIGERGPAVVDDRVIKELEEVTALAPLHNGPAVSILKKVMKSLPDAKNIAFFDSSFHSSLPDYVRTYAIDQEVAKKKKLRKYGFHGISYKWIVKNIAKKLEKEEKDVSIIALHLGSGASMCAIKQGKSYDTTMGLTPLEGLPGGSRSGSVDPSLIFHYTSRPADEDEMPPSVHLSHAENILNTSSGFKALAGTSDFGEILSKDPHTPESELTVKLFLDRVSGYLGSYWLKLKGGQGGVDAIVFAGGIGEKSSKFREMIVHELEGVGGDIEGIDKSKNEDAGKGDENVYAIGDGKGKVKLLVCLTNEELQMVEETLADEKLW